MPADQRPDQHVVRASFDATIDECAEVALRTYGASAAARRQRLRSHVLSVAIVIGSGLLTLNARRMRGPQQWVIAIAILLAIGVALLPVFAALTTWSVRRRVREVVVEHLGGRTVVRSDFEVRDDGLWSGSPVGDILIPWTRATRLVAGDDVEIWFDSTLAMVRARAFESPAHKAAFVAAVTSRLPASAVRD